jgi:molecular chaperone DnaK (HSP70)
MEEYSIVGIDFGTSTTVVKVKNYGEGISPRDYHSLQFNNSNCLPTLIYQSEDNKLFFGYEAEEKFDSSRGKGILYKNFKMDLSGKSDQQANTKWLIEEFFKYIYSEFSKQRNGFNVCPDVKVYISYPAKWIPEVRDLMKQCAIEAGFGTESNVFGEDEPTAAIYASFASHLEDLQRRGIIVCNKPVNVMMLDMGAGTSDIAIFKFRIDSNNKPVINELITFPTAENVYLCGGREIDDLLEEDLNKYITKISKNNQISQTIKKAINKSAKKWKEQNVSPILKDNKTVEVPPSRVYDLISEKQNEGSYDNWPFEINRRQFELLTQRHWKELHSLITGSINEAKKRLKEFHGAEDIDLVILTGGHSQWYGIRDFILRDDFACLESLNFLKIKQEPQRLLQEANPQETVAKGLVYKDVPFDVKHTMGNSLWIQFEIDGKESELFEAVSINDVLPIPNEINKGTLDWQITINSNSLTTKDVKVLCHCYYGSNKENSIYKKSERIFAINNFLAAAIGGVFRTTGAAIGESYHFLTLQWGKLGKSTKYCFKETYTVKISTIINVSEDGTGKIKGTLGSDWNNGTPFEITL